MAFQGSCDSSGFTPSDASEAREYEVEYRYLSKQNGAAETTVQITRDPNDVNQTFVSGM